MPGAFGGEGTGAQSQPAALPCQPGAAVHGTPWLGRAPLAHLRSLCLPPQTETGGNHPLAQGQILISLPALGVGMRQSPPLVQRGACICPWTSTG